MSRSAPPATGATTRRSSRRLPRTLHPGAWWIWALGMATAASRTTNPLLLAVVLAVVAFVVSERRTDAPWARGFKAYLFMGLFIIGIRVVFRMLLDGHYGQTVLFTLPEIPLPEAAAGIRIGGAVSLEGILAALYDGLRLATLLICLGAANVLANPKRLLKVVPGALHELGVSITVALTVAPQLVESAQRVHKARRLRGEHGRRTHLFREVVIPVMTDALDRSLLLAAAMDSRGYGRRLDLSPPLRRAGATLMVAGLAGVCIGVYGLLDATAPTALGVPMLAFGLFAAAVSFAVSGRQIRRTRYRPDPWVAPEWAVSLCGVIVAVTLFVAAGVDPAGVNPSLQPLRWPPLPVLATVGVLVGVLPAWIAPPVRTASGRRLQ